MSRIATIEASTGVSAFYYRKKPNPEFGWLQNTLLSYLQCEKATYLDAKWD
jgi:hypothetical protein